MNRKLRSLENVLDKIPNEYKGNIISLKRIDISCPECGVKTILCCHFLDYVVVDSWIWSRREEIVDRYVHACLNSKCDYIGFEHRHKNNNGCFCLLCKGFPSFMIISGQTVKAHKVDDILGEIVTIEKHETPDNGSKQLRRRF